MWIFYFTLNRKPQNYPISQPINLRKTKANAMLTFSTQSWTLERADKCTNHQLFSPFSLLISTLLLLISFLLISCFSSPPSPPPLPLLSPCYLSTRPWHLSLRSVAPSVALGWWMGWWTLGCHSNLMDGLATDTTAESAPKHTHTHTYRNTHTTPRGVCGSLTLRSTDLRQSQLPS